MKTAPPSWAGSAARTGDAVDLLDPRAVMRAQAFPERLDGREVLGGSAHARRPGAKVSSFKARMSVRRHSSSRAVGQGNAWNAANASSRRSMSQSGSSRPFRKASKVASVKPPVAWMQKSWLHCSSRLDSQSYRKVSIERSFRVSPDLLEAYGFASMSDGRSPGSSW